VANAFSEDFRFVFLGIKVRPQRSAMRFSCAAGQNTESIRETTLLGFEWFPIL
jgi:hypothetical protein